MTRSLIEQWFPADTIGAESLRERGSAKAYPPINFLHVWWARRPLIASRAAVVGSLLPAWPTEDDLDANPQAEEVLAGLRDQFADEDAYHQWFVRSLGILGDPVEARRLITAANQVGKRLPGGGYKHDRAFKVTPDEETIEQIHRLAALRADVDEPPRVLDPFAGGGAIPFEAARMGCSTIANELIPVAVAILDGTVRLPAILGPEFAEVIDDYGSKWAERVQRRLASFFPKEANDDSIAGYVWAHTVPCPTSGRPTPLAPNFWLARGKAGREVAVRLDVDPDEGTVQPVIVEGGGAKEHGDRTTYKGGSAVSVWSPETTFDTDYINAQAQAGKLGQMLLAVSVTQPSLRRRQFRAPTEGDLAALDAVDVELARRLPSWEVDDLVPSEPVLPGAKTNELLRMGLTQWRDLFNPRQLLTNITALEELHRVLGEARSKLDKEQLHGLGLYLAFALDKAIDYNSRLASWDPTRTKVRNTFDRHDFGFKWSFSEFDGAGALIPWAVKNAVMNHEKITALVHTRESLFSPARAVQAQVLLGPAAELDLPDSSVDAVVTDPPYYDNVMYGELSDFFHVWLKRALRDTWPEISTEMLSDKDREVVANPSRFTEVATASGRGKRAPGTKTASQLADERYESLLSECFSEGHRVLKDDGVFTVMFTHKRVEAWDTLGAALLESGFEILSSWPVHTESEHSLHQAKKNAASSTILLTCRKRSSSEPAYWEDLKREVAQVARRAAARFSEEGITGVDLSIATYGPALSVLSRNWPVYTGQLNDQGEREVLRPDAALDLAREEVADLKKRGLLGGREVDFDRPTDWWLLAWSDFQAAQFPSGEALKLSIATHLDLDDLLKEHRLAKSSSGNVVLLTPAQRRTAGALETDDSAWPTMVDALHALMLTYDEEGPQAAEAWLDRTGYRDNERFRALVQAALNAVPRVKEKGEFARPEAQTLDRLRTALFGDIPPPPDPEKEIAEQLALVEGDDG